MPGLIPIVKTMKLIAILLCLFVQGNPSTYIEGKGFSGYVFNKAYPLLLNLENCVRYTPSKGDILVAEKILAGNIAAANAECANQPKGYPVLHKELTKYIRQYVGFVNTSSGQKVIWINCLWKKDHSEKTLSQDVLQVHDGGSYYWNCRINLQTKKVTDLRVNGFG